MPDGIGSGTVVGVLQIAIRAGKRLALGVEYGSGDPSLSEEASGAEQQQGEEESETVGQCEHDLSHFDDGTNLPFGAPKQKIALPNCRIFRMDCREMADETAKNAKRFAKFAKPACVPIGSVNSVTASQFSLCDLCGKQNHQAVGPHEAVSFTTENTENSRNGEHRAGLRP